MKLIEYSNSIKQTAIYPKQVGKFYTVLGMIDEIGEVSEKLDFEENKQKIADEIGDTFWYITATLREFGFDDLFEWFENNRVMDVNKDDHPKYLGKIGMQLGAQLAGRLKKVIRDESMEFTIDKQKEIKTFVKSYMNTMIIIVNKMNLSFDDIFQGNIDKLLDRQDRGVIKGDGDNR